MATAQIARVKTAILASIVMAAVLANPEFAKAAVGSPQTCTSGSSCTIGEFLYNDEYTPITTSGACTITSRYPDGSLFLNAQIMTVSTDGWYSYAFTTPATLGYYRSTICCTSGTDYLCIDKSFESKAAEGTSLTANDVAAAVWSYSSRSMTGFGSLVSDIWSNSSRSLSSFGTLAQDVWNHNPRALTSSSSGDLAEIEKTVKENRMLLEQLVNKPIIENSIEEGKPDLGAMVSQTRETAGQMYLDTQTVVSDLGVVILSWGKMTGEEVGTALAQMQSQVGQEGDKAGGRSLISQADGLKTTWGWPVAGQAYDQAVTLAAALGGADRALKGVGGLDAGYQEAKTALVSAEELEKTLGTSQDDGKAKTVYGQLAYVAKMAEDLNGRQAQVDKLLAGWSPATAIEKQSEIDDLSAAVLAINQVPQGAVALTGSKDSDIVDKRLENELLAVGGLINLNRVYLAQGAAGAMAYTWLEEGSVVFKSVLTNPSQILAQEVEVKYYLPSEVKEENVIETDPGLSVKFDAEKNRYYVLGTYLLKAGESRTVTVRVNDIWTISDADIASLRQQAQTLAKPLEKTAYFAQGVTLTSDINVSLDKAAALMAAAVTPEQKIRSYREAEIELGGVQVKMEQLKNLVGQASVTGGLLGFVGGAQVVAVWGLVIILLAGFVFLALYMRMIAGRGVKVEVKEEGEAKSEQGHDGHVRDHGSGWRVALTAIVAAVVSSAVSIGGMNYLAGMKAQAQKPMVAQAVSAPEVKGETAKAVGGPDLVRIVVGPGKTVDVRQGPAGDAKIVNKLDKTTVVERLGSEGGWVQFVDDAGKGGWVIKDVVEEGQPGT